MTGNANIEFRKAVVPDDIEALCDFDRKVFGAYPDDLFLPEDWAELESYWLMADGNTIGCLALKGDVDYDRGAQAGMFVYREHRGITGIPGTGLRCQNERVADRVCQGVMDLRRL